LALRLLQQELAAPYYAGMATLLIGTAVTFDMLRDLAVKALLSNPKYFA
jgi:hypothetical protein